MVRPTSDIWALFDLTKTKDGKKSKATCKFCNLIYSFPNATRMTAHITKCIKCPKDIQNKFRDVKPQKYPAVQEVKCTTSTYIVASQKDAEDDSLSVERSTSTTSTISEIESTPSTSLSSSVTPVSLNKRRKIAVSSPSIMSKFVDTICQNESEKIDEAIARALYASGAPLSLLDNQYWTAAFKIIRPSYTLPSTYKFSNSLLDAEYERVRRASEAKINEANSLTLTSDGWTNIRGEGVINFIVCTPSPIFYKSIQPGIERETSEYISNQMINVINEIGNGKFFLVVTDNASNMKAAWKVITEKYPHISCTGCAAHSLNLLLNDFMKIKAFTKTTRHSKNICKYIKKHHVIYAAFSNVQAEKYARNKIITLKVPGKTRWGSMVLTLDSLLKNKEALQHTVLMEELKIDIKIKKNVLDDDFWAKIETILDVLTPVATAIKIIESDRALLSEVPELFHFIKARSSNIDNLANLKLGFTSDLKNTLLGYIEERYEFCCKPIHLTANLLDPRFRGEKLTEEEVSLAIDFISHKAGVLNLDGAKIIANLAQYRTKTGFFSRDTLWMSSIETHPVVWWQGLCTTQPLTQLAARILSGIPSSAACERNWSLHGNIHTPLRNRLSGQRVKIFLICVFFYFKEYSIFRWKNW